MFKTKIQQLPGEPLNEEKLIDIMYQDKKVTNNQLNFILLNRIGKGKLIKNISPKYVKEVLKKSIN